MGPDNKRISPPLPGNIDAERSILGAILLDNSALGAAARLKPEDFFFPHHQVIFRHMVALGEVQRPIDLVTLFDELQSQGVIAAAGGEAYLAQLVDGVPRVVNVEHYARIVKDKAILRNLIHAVDAIQQQALERGALADEVAADALERIARAAETGCVGVRVADVRTERVSWLWCSRIPLGKVTILDGDPGLGKSILMLDIAARVTRGLPMPDGTQGVHGGVVLLSGEDGLGDTIRPRLEVAGADLNRIIAFGAESTLPVVSNQIALIERAVRFVDGRLVVLDPLVAFFSCATNSWRDSDVRRALAPLASFAERTDAAVVVIRHLNKTANGNPLYRGGGSIGIIGAARSALLVGRHPEDDSKRVLATVKSNLALPAPSLEFRLGGAREGTVRIVWGPATQHTAAELLAQMESKEERSAIDVTCEFLTDLLANGSVPAEEVSKRARKALISDRTLERAKSRLRVRSRKDGFGLGATWLWELPPDPTKNSNPRSKSAEDEFLAPFGELPQRKALNSATCSKTAKPENLADFEAELAVFEEEVALQCEWDHAGNST